MMSTYLRNVEKSRVFRQTMGFRDFWSSTKGLFRGEKRKKKETPEVGKSTQKGKLATRGFRRTIRRLQSTTAIRTHTIC